VAGKAASFFSLPDKMFLQGVKDSMGLPEWAAEGILEMMHLVNSSGYFGSEPLDESLALLEDQPTSWVEFLRTTRLSRISNEVHTFRGRLMVLSISENLKAIYKMEIRVIGSQSVCIRDAFRIRSSAVYLIEPRFATRIASALYVTIQ
jgi:hypothetical protein